MSFQNIHHINQRLSYWEQATFFRNIDIAIIGSRIVGLSTAIHLKNLSSKLNIAVFERGHLPSGAITKKIRVCLF